MRRQNRTAQLSKTANMFKAITDEDKASDDKRTWEQWISNYSAALQKEHSSTISSRLQLMEESNPTFILRNWIAQEAILAAEEGDYSKVYFNEFVMLNTHTRSIPCWKCVKIHSQQNTTVF